MERTDIMLKYKINILYICIITRVVLQLVAAIRGHNAVSAFSVEREDNKVLPPC
jgi:hypothetical protein